MSTILATSVGRMNTSNNRKYMEQAYERTSRYFEKNPTTISDLEKLLSGDLEAEQFADTRKDLLAGQVKQIAIPTGKTLEETVAIWQGVRRDALSVQEPTTADFQLAATAAAKINETEAQIALNRKAARMLEEDAARTEEAVAEVDKVTEEMGSPGDWERLLQKKRYEKAITSYSFHIQMKRNGFEVQQPSFSRIA